MPPARRSRRDEPSSSESDSSSSDESSSSSSNSSSDSSSSSGSDSETTTSRSRTSGSTSATGTTTTTTTSRSTTSKTSTTPTSTSATSPSASSMKRRVSFMPTPLNDNRSGSDSSSGSDSTDDDDSTTETTSTTTASTSGTTTTTGTSATGDSRHGKSRRRPNEDDDENSSTSDEETQSETTTTTGTESTSATTSGTTTNTTTTHTSATTALTSATGSTIPRPRRPRNPKADKDETSSSSSSTTSSDEEDETETDDTTTTNDTSTRQTDVASPRDEFERALQAKALETELSVDLRGTKTLRAMEMSNSEPGTPAIPQISIPKPPPHRPGTTPTAPAAVEQVKQSVEGFDSEQSTPVHQALPVPHPPPSRPIQAMGVGLEDDTDDGVAGGSETNESSGKGQLQEVEKNDENGRISTATLPPHGHPLDDSQADQPTVDDSIQNMGEDEDLPRIGTIESVGDAVRVMKPLRKPVVVGQAALLDVDEHPLASQMKDENVSMAIIVRDRAVNNAIDALESEASVYERRRESTATTPTPGSRRGSTTTTGVVRNRYGDDADSADGGSSVKRPGGNGPSSQHHPNGSDDDGGSTIASSPDESFIDDASSSNVPTGRPGRRAATTPRPAPKKTITRYIRDTMGVSAQPSHVHYDPLPAWFMIEYASPQDYVAKLIRQQLDHQEQAEEGQADETRCPRNRLSKANAVMLLRAFELDDRKIKELTMTLGPHATLGDVQNLIEEETLTLTAKALEKAVHTADTYRSGELPSFQINKVLINSGIGNSDIGTNKVSVRLGMFKRSLGVSIQQLSDKPQFFDLVQSARFRVNSVPGSQNIIINDTYIVSNLTNSEREETMLALNAAVYIRKVIDQATMDDHSVEYGPVLRNLLCHPVGWSKSTAVANKRKSFFREKIVQWCLKPASKIEAIRNRSLPPFLLRTVAAKESHHFNFMPEIHIDRNEGTAHLEKTVEDLSKKHITIAINEVRLPGEEIPSGSTLYLLVSTISEGQEALPAVRLPCNPQTKPSDIWTFPKGRNSLIAYGNRTDIIYLEMCYDVKGEPRTAGFSSITLEKAKDGASALWVTGGTIYQQHRKRDTTEATKSCFCMTGPPPVHMLVEFSKVKATVLTHFNATVYPARFICEESHYALVGQCREAIFDRLSDSPHVLHVVRDIYVKKALSITEDATLMSVFSEIWNKHVKKFTKDHRKDPRYIRQQLLQLMNKVAAARNLVVDPQEIVKIISHDGRINLLPNAPLKPVHSEVSVSVGAKLLEGI